MQILFSLEKPKPLWHSDYFSRKHLFLVGFTLTKAAACGKNDKHFNLPGKIVGWLISLQKLCPTLYQSWLDARELFQRFTRLTFLLTPLLSKTNNEEKWKIQTREPVGVEKREELEGSDNHAIFHCVVLATQFPSLLSAHVWPDVSEVAACHAGCKLGAHARTSIHLISKPRNGKRPWQMYDKAIAEQKGRLFVLWKTEHIGWFCTKHRPRRHNSPVIWFTKSSVGLQGRWREITSAQGLCPIGYAETLRVITLSRKCRGPLFFYEL